MNNDTSVPLSEQPEWRPRLLDLFCGAGGAAMGYHRAGFEVVGVDIEDQPRYPFAFVKADALVVLRFVVAAKGAGFRAIHASPPCQGYTQAHRIQRRQHPLTIAEVRPLLRKTGVPYIIENVEGAPLKRGAVLLCGAMFPGLGVYRHRLFETSFPVTAPAHPVHEKTLAKMGRPVEDEQFMHVVGNFSDVQRARRAMGTPWMARNDISEAIPPAYTEHVGRQLLAAIERAA